MDESVDVVPLDEERAPLGTHEVAPRSDATRVESPAARNRTPAPRAANASSPPPNVPRERGVDRVGAVLGSYRLVELIGKGGMGYVYRAEHVKLGREVALKVLRLDYARRRDSVARFFQEARTVNRIRHRNIVDVTDFIELDDGTTFIIMELLRGQSLGRWARDHVDLPRALALLVQICDGLAAAHAVGVIHRDLKPDNVIIVPTGDGAEQVKLLDFGVAKLVHRDDEDFGLETAAGSVIGTPAYMSPEQAGGQTVDGRSDIYSLGAIMYELFCGVPMFRGRSFGEYVRKHLQERPIAPRDTARGASLDPRVEDILLRCIEKEPERRYPSIEMLRDDLLATLGGIETMDPGRAMPLPAPPLSGIFSPSIASLPTLPPLPRASVAPATAPLAAELAPEPFVLARPRARVGTWLGVAALATAVGIGAYLLVASSADHPSAPTAQTAQTAPTAPVTTTAPAPTARPGPVPTAPAPSVTAVPVPATATAPTPAPATAPVRLPLVSLRVDSTPAADVLIEHNSTPLCSTPCTITIDPNDGGRTDQRVLTLHRDGFRDHTVTVDLAAPTPAVRATLTRVAAIVRGPHSTSHHATSTPPAHVEPAHVEPAHVAPPTPTPQAKDKRKVDATQTIDPFH